MIKSIEVFDLNVPLKVPYHTAIADIPFFTSLVVRLRDDKGNEGLGECTTVLGYSWESPEDAWGFAKAHGVELLNQELTNAKEKLQPWVHKHPFACTAFLTAIELLQGESLLKSPSTRKEVELVGIVNATTKDQSLGIAEKLLQSGYGTLKVKVGFDVERDIDKVRAIQSQVGSRGKIRIDANQHYTYSEAERFVDSVDPSNIELFEQPFGNDAWGAMKQLSLISPLPLMLDESIYGLEEVERTAKEKCAQWIKFKLMKSSSAQSMAAAIRLAQKHGIGIIYGNGVATEIGCYHEALLCSNLGVKTAGEQNGFLKTVAPICIEAPKFVDGKVILEPDFCLRLNDEQVLEWTKNKMQWQA
ncbi:MAG: mandelate racemase/muconate lactonizing enzyme family protein [Desulfitobacterium sp.]